MSVAAARIPTSRARPDPADLARVRAHMANGLHPDEIAVEEGWPAEKVAHLRGVVIAEEERHLIGRRTEDVYVEYVMRTRAHAQQLDELLDELRSSKQGSAAVGAIKAKQQLMDRVIELGQQFGFVERRPVEHRVGVVIAKLDDAALRERLAADLRELHGMMLRHGGAHLLEVAPDAGAPVPSGVVVETSTLRAPPRERSEFAPPPAERVIRRKARRRATED